MTLRPPPATVQAWALLAVSHDVDASYGKIHLYDALGSRESDTEKAESAPTLLEIDGVHIGLAACYCLRLPGLFQRYTYADASAVITSASSGADRGRQTSGSLGSARAFDSTCGLIACDRADPRVVDDEAVAGTPAAVGRSAIIATRGAEPDRAGGANETIVDEISREAIDQTRTTLPVLDNCDPWERPILEAARA